MQFPRGQVGSWRRRVVKTYYEDLIDINDTGAMVAKLTNKPEDQAAFEKLVELSREGLEANRIWWPATRRDALNRVQKEVRLVIATMQVSAAKRVTAVQLAARATDGGVC